MELQKKKMNVVLATMGLDFTGNTLQKQALGGSETALIYIAKELVKLGHDVRVFNNCSEEGTFDGVHYQSISNWAVTWQYIDCDIFIVSRFFDLGRVKINSKVTILWNHDVCAEPEKLMSSIWAYDYMYCLSEFHKKDFTSRIKEFEQLIKLNSNGVDFSIVQDLPKKHQVMFTSRPERGLFKTLELFEKYNDKELQLLVCNYETLDVKEVKDIETVCMDKIQQLVNKGFKISMGRFTKDELYKHIAESKAVLYPTEFPEIFCISGIEAQANKTYFLTTHDFAMVETVGYKGIVKGEQYDQRFLNKMKAILTDDKIRKENELIGFAHVQQYSWENVAKKFESDWMDYFTERSADIDGVLKKLEYESDLIPARELAKLHKKDEWVKYLDHQLRFVDHPELTKEIYEQEDTHERIEMSQEDLEKNTRFAWLADMVNDHKVETLLDYACHMGLSSIITSNRNPQVKITGYDISEKAIEKAKQRAPKYAKTPENLNFVCNKDDLKEGSFDALFCGEYLEHVLDVEGEIARLEKYVKDGGKMFFTVPRGAWEWMSRELNVQKDVVYHVSSIDANDVLNLFGHRKDFGVLSLMSGAGPSGEIVGQTLIQYTKDDQAVGKRDFAKKFLTTRPYQGISACIIAKDASKDIEHCLDSFYKNVDEIIIAYDPASKDKEDFLNRVKKYYNVKVYDMPHAIGKPDLWGFANARNFTLSKAKENWIFWIDTDERLIVTDIMRKYIDTNFIRGYTIRQHHAQLDSFVEADRPTRLFKRGVAEFVGYIHEQPQLVDDINAPIDPSLVLDCAKIVNFGMIHEGMRRDKALGRNMELLKVDAAENVDKRKKAKLPIRKLTMILILRDFYNRMQWGYEKYKTFQTRDVMEHCLPKMKAIYNEYFRKEKDALYREMAESIMQQAYGAANIGIPCEVKIADKTIKMRVDLDDIESFKELVSNKLNDARKIS